MKSRRSNESNSVQEKFLTQPRIKKRKGKVTSLSQPVPSTSSNNDSTHAAYGIFSDEEPCSQSFRGSTLHRILSEEEGQLVNTVVRYLFTMDRKKQIINKTRIIKNVFGGQGKYFHRVMSKVKDVLSKVFGYNLMELEGNKYMLVNQLENDLPHINFLGTEGTGQVLLFLVLTHIYMNEESCTQEFLTNLSILPENNQSHVNFGNVKHIVTEVFVDQKYLEKIQSEQNDAVRVEYKWGPRAEYEFSPRAALEFASQVYNGRSLDSWPLQFKALTAWENRLD
ncbi:non-structural maintenance of chromosomes element 3 homolog isoform X2 [Nomia melanderi]|uniref:non-structural maintenance of chromosomes element 3 homolog isoform X2 n=1 Tax=Nomia melanderi TaxID=2448451 RepID=UPI003FCE6647